jgi:hypothetical protein
MENIPIFFTIQILMLPCDFSKKQKCSFEECPLTWVAPLIMFLLDKISID